MTAPKRSNAAAANRSIRAMGKSGRLEGVDDMKVEVVRFVARSLDQLPSGTSAASRASLVRAYLSAIKLLVGESDTVDDQGISEIIAALSTPASWPSKDELG
jgi:hypothetical protein